MDVEPVGEEHGGAAAEVRRDVGLVDRRLDLVGKQQRDDLCAAHRLGDRRDGEPRLLGGSPRAAALAEPDLDLDAGVVEVEGMGVALAAVADDRDLPVEEAEVAVRGEPLPWSSFQLTDSLETWARRDRRAREADAAGAGELADAVRADELLERVELLRLADDLEDDASRGRRRRRGR